MPVLAMGSEKGGAGWPFYSLAQVAENVTGGIIPNCGHYIAEEQPDELLRRLNAFFSEEKTRIQQKVNTERESIH
jgi:pimeloyl-ACP methyl ester carboxylesterase